MAMNYAEYLQVNSLLELQKPLSDGPEHDELLFITIHQVYELWFKQTLHELSLLQYALEHNQPAVALATFKRMLTILKTMVSQVDILETMTPVSFTSFRSRLESASGFQSLQFRELEFVLGNKRPAFLEYFPEGSEERRRLEARLLKPSLYDSFLRFLALRGHPVPQETFAVDITRPREPSPELQRLLIELYHHHPVEMQICERLVDYDEGLQEWRYRHVKMVERTIGFKAGTGGSKGAEYLRQTLFKPAFPDLWQIRTSL